MSGSWVVVEKDRDSGKRTATFYSKEDAVSRYRERWESLTGGSHPWADEFLDEGGGEFVAGGRHMRMRREEDPTEDRLWTTGGGYPIVGGGPMMTMPRGPVFLGVEQTPPPDPVRFVRRPDGRMGWVPDPGEEG